MQPEAQSIRQSPSAMGTARGFLRLAMPYWYGPERWAAWLLSIALVLLDLAQVVLAIRLNLWSADLFDALERRSAEGSLRQIIIFAALVLGMMVVNAIHLHIKRALQLGWREWLTKELIGEWMHDGRQYRLSIAPGNHSNPDGRIAEDIRIATEAAVDLAHSLIYCLLLLISFLGILWGLSGNLPIHIDGITFDIPGHMVWLAFLYSGVGSALAMFIGRKLVSAADWRQTVEADLRYALGRSRENAEAIAVAQGEREERGLLLRLFKPVATAWHNQSTGLRQLILFTSAYSTLATIFPVLVSTPRYLLGEITLGGLMQTAQAFQQATAALSWPVDNFPRLAELQASAERVLELDQSLSAAEAIRANQHSDERIVVAKTSDAALGFRNVTIAEPDQRIISAGLSLEIRRGERVLLTGDQHAAAVLCKAVAGVWPWGRGRIEVPSQSLALLPQRPYMPPGTLRHALLYPVTPPQGGDTVLTDMLHRVGLDYLLPQLDTEADWGQALSPGDLQRIGFARLLLHRPLWILIDQATDGLDEKSQLALLHMLGEMLPEATILAVGHRSDQNGFFTRHLVLERSEAGTVSLQEEPSPPAHEPSPAPMPPASLSSRIGRLIDLMRAGFGEG
ncbi:ABC transporter ATP-binding protein/permease [Ferrovibrio sp.]|uniref:ABC transporter ATP-binding protein/permease n=1 Tax=Ferrovibrio sp. TaxID=1917215 RepID=UPI002608D191|nr:ABC transporter ATP-binding protein/permease [Ferrovibrio sp.]